MIGLHAVVPDSPEMLPSLKRQMLFFDKFHLAHLTDSLPENFDVYRAYKADLEFLRSREVLLDFDTDTMIRAMFEANIAVGRDFLQSVQPSPGIEDPVEALTDFVVKSRKLRDSSIRDDYMVRHLSATMSDNEFDTVPICSNPLPNILSEPTPRLQEVLTIAVEALPLPDATCSWEDVLNFKDALHDKQWAFRRFLQLLATKQLREAEVRDEIEWMINEYTKAMRLHHMKSTQGAFEAYVIPAIEVVEDVAKFNWSKIAKGAVSVRKRKLELLEAETKATGRECAYVFDARKQFGE